MGSSGTYSEGDFDSHLFTVNLTRADLRKLRRDLERVDPDWKSYSDEEVIRELLFQGSKGHAMGMIDVRDRGIQ